MKHRIKTIVLYALPYVLAFFGLLFRKKQLDNDSALFTPIQFEFITWITVIFDPGINSFGDALWYLYAVISTAGFGDIVASGLISRIISVLVTVYSVIVIAVITGVIVNYYTQIVEAKNKETLSRFLDRLEQLPELDREELEELSEKVKRFRDE